MPDIQYQQQGLCLVLCDEERLRDHSRPGHYPNSYAQKKTRHDSPCLLRTV